MSKISWPNGALRCPTKQSGCGASRSAQHTLAGSSVDRAGWVTPSTSRSHRRRGSARRRSRRPVASPQHRPRRLAHHHPCEQRRERPVPLGELRDAGRRRSSVGRDLPWRGGRDRHGDPHDAPRGTAGRCRFPSRALCSWSVPASRPSRAVDVGSARMSRCPA